MTILIGSIVVAIVAAAALLVAFEGRWVFVPDRTIHATPASEGIAYSDIRIPVADGAVLDAWYVPAKNARAIVVVCHGNGGNISTRLALIAGLHGIGLSLLLFDYSGYGLSTGRPSEGATYRDAEAAWRWMDANVPMARSGRLPVVIMGRSLGGPIAAHLAAEHPPAGLILDSTFPSLRSLVRARAPYLPARLLLRFRFDTVASLKSVRCPVLVVHSLNDRVVPFEEGRSLYDAIRSPKEFLTIRGPHVEGFVYDSKRYTAAILRFLDIETVP